MENTQNAAHLKRQMLLDALFRLLTRSFAFLVLALLLGILLSLLVGALPSIKHFGFGFLASTAWDPVAQKFGAVVPIFGTLVTSIIALLIGVPVSFGIALFLTELCPPVLKRPLGIAVELLAGIPSIIYGMWGLFVFAPLFSEHVQPWVLEHMGGLPLVGFLFQGAPMGIGIFTAGLILAIMVIPFIASVMRDVFEVVPPMLKESAYGLGGTTWEVVRYVVLPFTKTGVVGGIMLGLGRALGETMAVTFVIGNSSTFSTGLFDAGNSIASTLANEFAEANGDLYMASLIELGLILFFITFVVLACSKLLLLRLKKQEGRAS
ncbi:phosphate ABC transporter permease subunit PstC [Vogesella sp. LIG4]|uniref:phosphate ABC transporter permease subunit PstC n=1 Tax=Vogesella sp. LIG4 TaxID=1192162 RepID=UPI00081FE5A1|nr:phosphate ABC transporter permease subunit PstC [Vogesella sp. LIG4]SCK08313.1 phosphate transport system permease protein [Vogesella sp. LIG4]